MLRSNIVKTRDKDFRVKDKVMMLGDNFINVAIGDVGQVVSVNHVTTVVPYRVEFGDITVFCHSCEIEKV